MRVKHHASVFSNRVQNIFFDPSLAVGTLADKSVIDVGNTQDAGAKADLLTGDLPFAVIPFMVLYNERHHVLVGVNWFEDFSADCWMGFYRLVFVIVELAWFV